MTKLTLKALNGGPFNCLPAREVELEDEKILCNDVTLPGDFNPHNTRLWVIGHEFGAICAVWAQHEQDALDEAVDQNQMDCFLIEEANNTPGTSGADASDYPTLGTEDEEGITRLGNASEPFDLTNAWLQEVDLEPTRDWKLLCRFAEARGNGADSLYF